MIDIKRLHKVHEVYPHVPRRLGKTTYCFDSLLRALQTGFYKKLCYITSGSDAATFNFKKFKNYLTSNDIVFDEYDTRKLKVLNSSVVFTVQGDWKITENSDGIIEDLFK